ncbi:MAG TPA: DUF3306 domain-containing protein [Geminicoccaceae bacterium]|nr:DUF3306 domain-containing protein [Geminicoccaceae bacterium]
MTDGESFLGRWSRLKRDAAKEPPRDLLAPMEVPEGDTPPAADAAAEDEAARIAALPPVDSLGAESDYTPFLARGVPAALRTLALRKAWASDPAIANFRGFAEYDWDCNAPGYGQLLAGDDVRRLCDELMRREARAGNEAERPEAAAPADPALPDAEAGDSANPVALHVADGRDEEDRVEGETIDTVERSDSNVRGMTTD